MTFLAAAAAAAAARIAAVGFERPECPRHTTLVVLVSTPVLVCILVSMQVASLHDDATPVIFLIGLSLLLGRCTPRCDQLGRHVATSRKMMAQGQVVDEW